MIVFLSWAFIIGFGFLAYCIIRAGTKRWMP